MSRNSEEVSVEQMTFGARLKYFRKQKGMSQIQLSKGICSNTLVSMLEAGNGNPSIKVAKGLAERLGVDYFTLVPLTENDDKEKHLFQRINYFLEAKDWTNAYDLAKDYQSFDELTNQDCVSVVISLAMYSVEVEKSYEKAKMIVKQGLEYVGFDLIPRAKILQCEGHVHRTFGNWHDAYCSYRMGLDTISNEKISGRTYAELSYHLGVACNMCGRNKEASLHLFNAYTYYGGGNDLRSKANVLYSMGVANKKLETLKEAFDLYQQVNDQYMLMMLRQVIAFNHTSKSNYHEAVIDLLNLGKEFADRGLQNESLHNFARALKVAIENNDSTVSEMAVGRIKSVLMNIEGTSSSVGEAYFSLALYEFKIVCDITEAKRYSVMAGELFLSNGMDQDAKNAYALAVECCKELGEYQLAVELFMPFVGGEKNVS